MVLVLVLAHSEHRFQRESCKRPNSRQTAEQRGRYEQNWELPSTSSTYPGPKKSRQNFRVDAVSLALACS